MAQVAPRRIATPTSVGQVVACGALAGMIAGGSMLVYSMFLALAFTHYSALTPIYIAASPMAGMRHVGEAMRNGGHVAVAALATGVAVHLAWSAAWGTLFGVLTWLEPRLRARSRRTALAFAFGVMLYMVLVAAPLSGAAPPAGVLGWPALIFAHGLFGYVLGSWPVCRPQDFRTVRLAPADQMPIATRPPRRPLAHRSLTA